MSLLPPLRAPREDGEILAVPPLNRIGELLERNTQLLADWPEPWREWVSQARQELLRRAGIATPPGLVLMAGHQPELFHPGVWLKNFALSGLARSNGGLSVNLIIDNDSVKSCDLLGLPEPGSLLPKVFRFASCHPETPWEEASISDRVRFEAFGSEVVGHMRRWGIEPLMSDFWPRVCRLSQIQPLGLAFAAARREVEKTLGCENVEIPQSELCSTTAFARFVNLLLVDPYRFLDLYNAALKDYRIRHRLRSKNHPVPDLASDNGAELPLWAWRADQVPVRRKRVFAQVKRDKVELKVNGNVVGTTTPSRMEETLGLLKSGPWKFRTRALTTTMFARLFLSDLFIHGIGGGKYDELTDDIITRLWGIRPPSYLVLTGTRLLPVSMPVVNEEMVRSQARLLRDLDWNPERYLNEQETAHLSPMIELKRKLIAEAPSTSAQRKERFQRLNQINRIMRARSVVMDRRHKARKELDRVALQFAERQVLKRRDYSFCFYPARTLFPFLTQLL